MNVTTWLGLALLMPSVASIAALPESTLFDVGKAPDNYAMQATVVCTSVAERTKPLAESIQALRIAADSMSIAQWSNTVAELVLKETSDEHWGKRERWHLQYRKLGSSERFDTLEGILGERYPNATFNNPARTSIAHGYPANGTYTNYDIEPANQGVRITTETNLFSHPISKRLLLELPVTINIILHFMAGDQSALTFNVKPAGEGLQSLEILNRSGTRLLKAFYNESAHKWVGIFVGRDKLIAAAVSATGIEFPPESPTMFIDFLPAGDKAKYFATLIDPISYSLTNVAESEFAVTIPTNWLVADQVRGVATMGLGGKVLGPVLQIAPQTSNDARRH
ncbi:MAG TPA: hypothetical protein VFD66_05285 [Verrucomicrobiae bacterium]|nr:hypothetical protein [Verrucomicrobiae bacterium]